MNENNLQKKRCTTNKGRTPIFQVMLKTSRLSVDKTFFSHNKEDSRCQSN